jgi:hypothetical protein
MSPGEALVLARSRGARLSVVGDRLRVEGPRGITTLRPLLREHRDAIRHLLTREAVEAEWRIEGCSRFTVLDGADEAAEARFGACLSCGASIELHGSPTPSEWRQVADLDDVQLVAVRYVIAAAAAIVRGSSR